jgi:hypothetical protein
MVIRQSVSIPAFAARGTEAKEVISAIDIIASGDFVNSPGQSRMLINNGIVATVDENEKEKFLTQIEHELEAAKFILIKLGILDKEDAGRTDEEIRAKWQRFLAAPSQ